MKRIHKIFIFVICMFMTGFLILNLGETPKVWADETKVADIVINIGEGQNTPESTFGKDITIEIPLINEGKDDATKVVITPILDSSTDVFPYEIKQMNYEKTVGTLKGTVSEADRTKRTVPISYEFTTRKDAPSGYTKLSFLITYTPLGTDGTEGIRESVEKDLFVKTIGAPPPTEAPTAPPPTEVPTAAPPVEDPQPIEPSFVPEPNPAPELPDSVPRVIVSGFTTEPAYVKAGDQFKLILHITNTSSKTSVNNLEFNILSEAEGADPATAAEAFMPVSGSSTIFLKSIGKEETKDITIDMTAKADLAQKPYVINLGIKYEDAKATQYTSDTSVSIPVRQEARVDVNEPQIMPNSIMAGQESNVMFSIYNLGKTKIYNTSVKFESDSISGGDAFVGNIEPGAAGNVDTMLQGMTPTMDDGIVKVIITYEDEAGVESTIEKEITLFVNEPFIEEEFPIEDDFLEEDSNGISPFIIVIIIIIIGIVVYLIIRRRKKMKEIEEYELDEEGIEEEGIEEEGTEEDEIF